MVISSPFEFWTGLELIWYFYKLGLILEMNLETVQTLWVWRTGCSHGGDVSACLAQACITAGVPRLVTVPALVLPSPSGNTENATSRDNKDAFQVIQRVYPKSV